MFVVIALKSSNKSFLEHLFLLIVVKCSMSNFEILIFARPFNFAIFANLRN